MATGWGHRKNKVEQLEKFTTFYTRGDADFVCICFVPSGGLQGKVKIKKKRNKAEKKGKK